MSSRKLRYGIAATGAMLAFSGVAALPTASADACTVKVTLLDGQTLSFNVDVPPGTPLSAISLPVTGPIKNVSESCQPSTTTQTTQTAPPATTPTGTTPTTTTTTPTTTTTTTPSGHKPAKKPGKKVAKPPRTKPRGKSGKPGAPKLNKAAKPGAGKKKKAAAPPAGLRGKGGVPTVSNPTFSYALPGPAPLGVPNFFIDSFRIPPFLLPIYQAAGIQYDVPWQVLAGINEIETDYGRNLSISSAGAVGWMQFLPQTWKTYGLDANGDGVADPYNPVDAIFTAARYLHAAGAAQNIGKAIFAYNHASWYVQSVLLRAKLIGGMPDALIGALTGLVQGHFPVAATARYADDAIERLATRRVKGANAAIPVESQKGADSVSIFAHQNAPVIAVNDGKILKLGQSRKLGRYVELQDQTGNIFTYAHLGSIPAKYPVPKPVRVTAAQLAQELTTTPEAPAPTAPATAGRQGTSPTPRTSSTKSTAGAAAKISSGAPLTLKVSPSPAATQLPTTSATPAPSAPASTTAVKERLFAHPGRPASYAAGGALQVRNMATQISSFREYFSDVLHLGKNEYTLQALKPGAIVVAGTILGRVAAPSGKTASHLTFMIQPAGQNAPHIDPKPILDGWKLLEATAVYRAAGVNPFFGPGAKNASVGQVLLMSKEQLTNRVLADPHVTIYSCGRRDILSGLVDRRVLATIEFLSSSGLNPTVSGLICGHTLTGTNGVDAAGATGSSVDISRINNIPVQGHQGAGSITDIAIRRLLTLQGAMRPNEIVSLMSYKAQNNTLSLPDHANRIQVEFTPLFGANKKLSKEIKSILKPGQWIQLINRIGQIPEPTVPVAPSHYAIKAGAH